MSRRLTHLLRLTGELVCDAPICIGGLDALAVTDMPVVRDGRGRLVLPGTSLAGALFEALGVDESCDLRSAENASRVLIEDAAALDDAIDTEFWDGVGIDRITGAAARRVKFDREVIPQGARFDFCMTYEADGDLDEARRLMHRARRRLERGLSLGAGVTRGLGRVRLVKAQAIEIDWSDARQVLAWLTKGAAGLEDASERWRASQTDDGEDELILRIHWRPLQPLMVKAGREGLATDMLPFISRRADGRYALTLPGAGIKGALREQAERIVRTVLGLDIHPGRPLHEMVAVDVVQDVFGLARASTSSREADSGPGRGRLRVATTYAVEGKDRSAWEAFADDPEPARGDIARAMHVAIDRWTGGAAESFLYSAAEPMDTRWQPIVLTYRPRRDDNEALHLALLWLVLEDLRAGRIALGFGKTRGYGEIAIERIECEGGLVATHGLPATLDGARSLLDPAPAALKDAWQAWLATHTREHAA